MAWRSLRHPEDQLGPCPHADGFHDEDYKLTAFGELADGYLEKPFSLSLLKVRIEAIFKKLQPSRVFTYGEARVDLRATQPA